MTSIRACVRFASLAWLVIAFGIQYPAAVAQTPPDNGASEYPPHHQLTGSDLETFLDALVPTQLFRDHVAGAVVVVVKDGKVLLAKGFGYADVETRQPTTPMTLFRPGSISKLFTGIAVMQLVERGKIDLDRDVNDYLNFRIETPPGGVPVTMRRLLTHRAGFEEQLKEHFATTERPRQLGVHLAEHLPARLFPRGDVAAYSNYGVALAGYIVERVSGQPFDQYVTTEILAPLGMSYSTFQQPLPRDLQPLMSKGYRDFGQPARPFEIIPLAPAGGLSASAGDFGRFMLALLGGGTLDGKRIVAADTLAEMMRPQVPAPSGLPRMALVFVEHTIEGHRVIGHGGATEFFRSALMLTPEERFGLFVSYNSAGTSNAFEPLELLSRVISRYFGRVARAAVAASSNGVDAYSVSGAYQTARRGDKSFMKAAAMLGQVIVHARQDGKIEIGKSILSSVGGGVWRDLTPEMFDPPDRSVEVAFEIDERGTATKMRFPSLDFIRVPWHEDRRLVLPAIGASLTVIACTFVLWPVAAGVRRRFRQRFGDRSRDKREFISVRLALIPYLLSAVAVGWLRQLGMTDLTAFGPGLDTWLMALYAVAWLAVLGAPWIGWVTFRFWRDRVGNLFARVHQSAIAVSAIILSWAAVNWHIAGTTLRY